MSKKQREQQQGDWNQFVRTLLFSLDRWPDLEGVQAAVLPDFAQADKEKVGPHVLLLGGESHQYSEHAQHLPRIMNKRHILGAEIAAIARAAAERNARFVLQRAFAYQSYYPQGYIRQFNDLDIVVAGLDDLTRLLPALMELGYYVVRPLVLRCSDGADPWVGIAFNKQRADLPEPVMLDVCVSGPSISGVSYCRVPNSVWADRQSLTIDVSSVPMLPPTFNLLSLFIEAFERDQLYVRDLLDLDRMARQPLDMEQLCADISALQLGHEVDRFRRLVHRANLEHLFPLFDRLPRVGLPLPEQPRWVSRVLGHMAPMVVRRSLGRAAAGLGYGGLSEWLDWIEDAVPNASLWVYRRLSSRRVYTLGLPIYLFSAAGSGSSVGSKVGPQFERTELGEYVVVAGRRYFTRVRPVVSEDELAVIGGSLIDG